MSDTGRALIGFLVIVAMAFGAGFLLGDHMASGEQVVQQYHPEQRTSPNDVTIEVTPGAKPKLTAPTKPRGGTTVSVTEIRAGGGAPVLKTPEIELEPGVVYEKGEKCYTSEDFECPGLDLRLDLVQTDDGQQYVAVRGSDGTEIAGRYIPMASVTMPRDKRLTVAALDGGWLATATKDSGRWSGGVAAGEIDGRRYYGLAGGLSWR